MEDWVEVAKIFADQSPWLALVGVICYAVGPKAFDYLGKGKDVEMNKYATTLKSLQEYSKQLNERVALLEQELNVWRNKYYEIYSTYLKIKEKEITLPEDK